MTVTATGRAPILRVYVRRALGVRVKDVGFDVIQKSKDVTRESAPNAALMNSCTRKTGFLSGAFALMTATRDAPAAAPVSTSAPGRKLPGSSRRRAGDAATHAAKKAAMIARAVVAMETLLETCE